MADMNGWMMIPDAFANTLFATAGWTSVTLDMQHGLYDLASVTATLQALPGQTPRRIVRVPLNDPGVLGKVLDASADGVIIPMINSVDDAKAAADACWYPPKGSRSYGPALAALRSGATPYLEAAKTIEVWAMIETREALANVEAIAAVDGITGLYVGPSDLGLALGLEPKYDRDEPEMLEAYQRILDAAAAHGKSTGIFCASADYAARMAGRGFSLVTVISDVFLLRGGAGATLSALNASISA